MMNETIVMEAVPEAHAVMKAWDAYKKTSEYVNSSSWARRGPEYVDGALWEAFSLGWKHATERAAQIHENINPASDEERLARIPGAGAMGAVIEYRDKIRNPE